MNEQATVNTSGQGKDAIVPPEAQFYNYGAALFGYFWLFTNGLVSKDIFDEVRKNEGISFGRRFVRGLGSKGNVIAWKYKHWDSVQSFIKTQKRWSMFGRLLTGALLVAMSLLILWFIIALVEIIMKGK